MNDEETKPNDTQIYDLNESQPMEHRYNHIVGNELRCTMHGEAYCPVIRIKPTQVLELDTEGVLQLVDKG